MTDGQRIVARAAAFAARGFALPCPTAAAATPQAAAPHGPPHRRRHARHRRRRLLRVEEDLLLRGWSRDDLVRHGDAAREIANAAALRSVQ